jgi:hypothetical protein
MVMLAAIARAGCLREKNACHFQENPLNFPQQKLD